MNSIYKSLERSSVSGLDPHQIQILCEYLQSHCSDSSVCEASRVLLQLVVFAKGDNVTKSIQELYLDIIIGSSVEMDEFVSLGECIVKLLEMYRSYGAESLKGCCIELPFLDLECNPKKFSLTIRTLKTLVDMLTFWSNVAALLYEDRTSPLTLSSTISNRIVTVFVDVVEMLPNFDATATVVLTLSKAVQALLVHSNVAGVVFFASSEQNISSAHFACQVLDGLINWCSYALSCSERLITKSKSKDSNAGAVSPRSTMVTSGMYLQMARAMDNIATITHMFAQCASQDPSIAADVEVLLKRLNSVLQTHSASCESMRDNGNGLGLLCAPGSTSMPASSSNNTFVSYSAESMICLILSRLVRIAAALSSTQDVSATAIAPFLRLCQKNCVDLPMLHEVAALVSQHLCLHSDVSAALVQSWGTAHTALRAPLNVSGNSNSKNAATAVHKGAHFTPVSPLLAPTASSTKNTDSLLALQEKGPVSTAVAETVLDKVLAGDDHILVRQLTESVLNAGILVDQNDVMGQLSKVGVEF